MGLKDSLLGGSLCSLSSFIVENIMQKVYFDSGGPDVTVATALHTVVYIFQFACTVLIVLEKHTHTYIQKSNFVFPSWFTFHSYLCNASPTIGHLTEVNPIIINSDITDS